MSCLYWLLILLLPSDSFAHTPPAGVNYKFIENKGQWPSLVKFRADIPGGALFLENGGLSYNFFDNSILKKLHDGRIEKPEDAVLKFHALKVRFLNSNPLVETGGENKFAEYFNYYLGNDSNKWASSVSAYQKINYDDLYSGINLDIYTKNNTLKYDFIVQPQSDLSQLKMYYEGAVKICISNGDLVVTTSLGTLREKKPYCYQIVSGKLNVVPCEFLLSHDTVSFKFPKGYNRKEQLIIDPELIFSTYSGSYADNFGYTATFDSEGFLYAAGTVFAIGYPVTPGAFQTTYNGGYEITDIGITKYDTSGTKRIFSTYLGGKSTELPHSLIVNSNDELFLFGTTGSRNFPITSKAPYPAFKGGEEVFFYGLSAYFEEGTDMFIVKFNKDGSALLASSFIGGTLNDGINSSRSLRYNYADEIRGEIDIDKEDNVYIVSCTQSVDLQIIGNSFQKNHNGGNLDGCIIKFNKDISKVLWSSYLGGASEDAIYSIAIDSEENIYLAGGTNSNNFPANSNILPKNTIGGRADGFIAHVSTDGTKILHSVYMGSATYDQIYFVELSMAGDVFVLGQTYAPDSTYIINVKYSKPNSGQFITKINSALDTVIWSTVFGTGSGIPNISPTAFLVDICSKIYLAGWGGTPKSEDFTNFADPVTHPFNMETTRDKIPDPVPDDQKNFYLMVLADDASQLVYATFLGGNESAEHVDGGTSRFDRKGKIYQSVCAGCGGHSDFPIKPFNAVSPTNQSIRPHINCNNAVFKFDFNLPIVIADFKAEGCNPINFINKSLTQKATFFRWNFGDNTTSTEANPQHTYARSGTYKVTLKVFDNLTCNLSDSIVKEIYISPLYDGVSASANPQVIYQRQSSQLQAFPPSGYKYQWTPSATLNNANISNPIASPMDTTIYTVSITDSKNNCVYNASVTIYVDSVFCGEPDIYVPNAFTPNDDQNNDTLLVKGHYFEQFSFIIYNRWGEKIFESTDAKVGWDGYYKGMKADPGVFVYYLEATCFNQERFFKKGNVTLIR